MDDRVSREKISRLVEIEGLDAVHTDTLSRLSHRHQVLPAITALKKLCSHPDLIYAMYANTKGSSTAKSLTGSEGSRSGGGGGKAMDLQGGGFNEVTCGFDGCLSVFHNQNASQSPYQPLGCQLVHSGKLFVLVNLLRQIKSLDATDKVTGTITETLNPQ